MRNSFLRVVSASFLVCILFVFVACRGEKRASENTAGDDNAGVKSNQTMVDYVKKPLDKAHEIEQAVKQRNEELEDESTEVNEEESEDENSQ